MIDLIAKRPERRDSGTASEKDHRQVTPDIDMPDVFDRTIEAMKMVGQLGQPFQQAADGVLDRLYDCVTTMPVFVKIDDSVPLDSALLNRIVKAIREKMRVGFQYALTKGTGTHPVDLEPYWVVYFGGFWYLIGNEPYTGILKHYALDRIRNLRLSRAVFNGVPDDLDTILQGSANIWFTG
jgi:predicted DNA-binding transcriptional regulator YafY